ncbi:hypothetical protein F5J12DRAFT_175868 [Pisolithus orientalis]|nr:uncharacterized protein F5J12DRAFT_175868 [Pisolithus orientalis]KAI6032563.1 hypothetical protein F5J12DRAFT_175868 [Pisolithus orientalis]
MGRTKSPSVLRTKRSRECDTCVDGEYTTDRGLWVHMITLELVRKGQGCQLLRCVITPCRFAPSTAFRRAATPLLRTRFITHLFALTGVTSVVMRSGFRGLRASFARRARSLEGQRVFCESKGYVVRSKCVGSRERWPPGPCMTVSGPYSNHGRML